MFKYTARYKDFNDKDVEEDLYFHMMAPEMADIQFNPAFAEEGGFGEYVQAAMKTGDGRKIYTMYKLLIVNSFGRRSEDGARFIKKPEFTEEFLNSPAYEDFFMWLVTDPQHGDKFWQDITPPKLTALVEQLEDQSKSSGSTKTIDQMSREELESLIELRKKAQAAIGS